MDGDVANQDEGPRDPTDYETLWTQAAQTDNRKGPVLSKDLVPWLNRIHTSVFVDEVHKRPKTYSSRTRSVSIKILQTPAFDYAMGIVIITNMCVMIIETDLTADNQSALSGTVHWTEVCGWVALFTFVIELVLRLFAFRCEFWQDAWNLFDFFIVSTDFIFSIVGLVASNTFPVSVLRVFRLAKLARVSKVLRVFPELRLLLAGLMSSISSIFWGTLLLLFCLLVWSMVAVLFIHPLNESVDYGICERCPRAYSSVWQACLTMWQQVVIGDSWGSASIPLIEKHPVTLVFFIPLFLSVGMAVTNLILGVVVSVAQQAKDDLERSDHAEKALAKLKKQTHLLQLCKQMDTDKSGSLTHAEIRSGFDRPGEFRDIVASLGITTEDFDIVFSILDEDQSGAVSYKELVNHLCTMRGSDSQFMLAYVKYYITLIRNTILREMESNHKETMSLKKSVSQQVDNVTHQVQKFTSDVEKEVEKVAIGNQEDFGKGVEKLGSESEKETANATAERQIIDLDRHLHKMNLALEPNRVEVPDNACAQKETVRVHGGLEMHDVNIEVSQAHSCHRADIQAGRAALSTRVHDEAWFKDLCNDIDMFREDLKNMLTEINCKLGPQCLSSPAMDRSTSIKAQPALPLTFGLSPRSFLQMPGLCTSLSHSSGMQQELTTTGYT